MMRTVTDYLTALRDFLVARGLGEGNALQLGTTTFTAADVARLNEFIEARTEHCKKCPNCGTAIIYRGWSKTVRCLCGMRVEVAKKCF